MKKILIILISIALGLAAMLAYIWNKPHRSIQSFSTNLVTAENLSQAFEENETAANKQYLNKALTVTGVAAEISINDLNQQVILIQGRDEFSGVLCTFIEEHNKIQNGDIVKVSGFCNGYTTVVILDDCKIL